MKTVHVFISGFVQGVGFRRFVINKARELGLAGWVRNSPDGRVEALLQGQKGAADKIIEQISKGPFLSEVRDIRVSLEDSKITYSSFDITS